MPRAKKASAPQAAKPAAARKARVAPRAKAATAKPANPTAQPAVVERRLGSGPGSKLFYCGSYIGSATVPNFCGPDQGPQCDGCKAHQKAIMDGKVGSFPGHLVEYITAFRTLETHRVMTRVCEPKNLGRPIQHFSTEMLRWDEVRAERDIDDGTPVMASIFDTNEDGMMQDGTPFTGHYLFGNERNSYGRVLVFVASPNLLNESGKSCESKPQNFSSEMERWDSTRRDRDIDDGTPSMRAKFGNDAALTSLVVPTCPLL